ncbi:MAG: response regulator transcription factor [Tissierellia bacterium]|nr:response regulator transcription factor [Tissierellia bacterium]
MNILIIEDDDTISFALKTYLERFGYNSSVYEYLDDIMDINISDFDLIILDVNLPDGSGFDYLKYIREYDDIPVLMLTVKDNEDNILRGFEYGADEYITKPFSLPILKARIDNIFNRIYNHGEMFDFKDLSLNKDSKTAYIDDVPLDLSKQEYDVLEFLLFNKRINITREKLLDKVWESNHYGVNDNTLSVTIKRLREKLGIYGKHIKTIRGIGYRWEDMDG